MHGGIYFSLSLSPTDIMEELYRDLPPLEKGIYADIMKIFQADRAVTVQPTAHYFEGGVRIDERCAAGLFAKEAGTAMASSGKLEELEHALCAGFGRKGRTTTTQMLRRLRACVGESLTVVRTEQALAKALQAVREMGGEMDAVGFTDHSRVYNREWMEFIRLRNMLLTAQAILQSALARKESRGVHVRADYLVTDDVHFLTNTVVEGPDLRCRTQDVVFDRYTPERVTQSYTDYVERIVEQLQ